MGIQELSLRAVSDAVIRIRQSKLPDPKVIGNAGSFFKNPTIPASQFENLKKEFPNMFAYPNPDGTMTVGRGAGGGAGSGESTTTSCTRPSPPTTTSSVTTAWLRTIRARPGYSGATKFTSAGTRAPGPGRTGGMTCCPLKGETRNTTSDAGMSRVMPPVNRKREKHVI